MACWPFLRRMKSSDHARAERAGTVERQHRDDVFETVGGELLEQLLHASDSTWKIAVVLASLRIW